MKKYPSKTKRSSKTEPSLVSWFSVRRLLNQDEFLVALEDDVKLLLNERAFRAAFDWCVKDEDWSSLINIVDGQDRILRWMARRTDLSFPEWMVLVRFALARINSIHDRVLDRALQQRG